MKLSNIFTLGLIPFTGSLAYVLPYHQAAGMFADDTEAYWL